MQIVTSGGLNPLQVSSFSLNTTGSSSPSDITIAKLWSTGTSSTFATTNKIGSVFSPNGVFTFNVSEELTEGTNYFWLTYNISNIATVNNFVDAECNSITVGSAQTPSVTAPAGNRQITAYTSGAYCSVTGTGTNYYITNVTFNSINNTSVLSGTNNYNDYTGSIYTTIYPGSNYSVSAIIAKPDNGLCDLQESYTSAWIDWNRDGDFDDANEKILDGGDGCTSTSSYFLSANVSIPPGAVLGTTRLRVITYNGTTAPSSCGALTNAEIEDYAVVIDELPQMIYVSSTTTQTNTANVDTGSYKNEVIGVQIVTSGVINPIAITSFTFNTLGTTDPTTDLSKSQFWSSGTNSNFTTTTLFGTAVVSPNGDFTFNSSLILESGTNYFWLTYDVPVTAPTGNKIDAKCNSLVVSSITRFPSITTPPGNRTINAPTNMVYVSSTTSQYNAVVPRGDINQQIIGVEIVTNGASNPLTASSFTFNTTGTTDPANDIQNAKLWFTGTDANFSASLQVGTTVAAPNGTFNITPNTVLAYGINYFWLTYDTKSTAGCDPNVIDAECTSVTIGTPQTPTVTAPAGSRLITCGIPYFSKGNLPVNVLSSWSTTRDGTGPTPTSFSTGYNFFVQNGHSMITTVSTTIPYLMLESGSRVTGTHLIICTDLRINANTTYEQKYAASVGTYIQNFYIEDLGTWIHNNNGNLPSINRYFSPNSNQWFYQWGAGTFPEGTVWGNVLLNGTTLGSFGVSSVLLQIQGNLELRKNGGSSDYFTTYETETMNIGKNLIMSGGWWKGSTQNKILTMNVAGDFIMSGAIFYDYADGGNSTKTILNISGNVIITGGTLDFNKSTGGNSEINITGGSANSTWSQTGGTIVLGNTNVKIGKTLTIIDNNISGLASGRTFTVETGATLNCSVYAVKGSGNFTLAAGGTIGLGATNTDGALTSIANAGNIQVTGTRTFDAAGNYVYAGAANQFTGNQLPALISGALVISNTTYNGMVSLSQNTSVSGTLTLNTGALVSTSSNMLIITSIGTTTSGSNLSYVKGPMKKTWNTQFTFPVGDGGQWKRFEMLDLLNFDLTTEFIAEYKHIATTDNSDVLAPINHISGTGQWSFNRNLDPSNDAQCSVRLYWENKSMEGINDVANLVVARYNTATQWESRGGPGIDELDNTGYVTSSAQMAEFGEYTFGSLNGVNQLNGAPSVSTSAIIGSPFCAGTIIDVPYTITGTFYSGNIFTAQLSDASGNFASPTSIGTIVSTNAGTITATIPSAALTGTAYRIRVVSSTPSITGTDNGTNLTINALPDATITNPADRCVNDIPFNFSAATGGGDWSGTGITDPVAGTFDPATAGAATHNIYYSVTDINGCTNSDIEDIIVYPSPTATGSSNSPVCVGSALTLTGGPGAMTSYAWSGPDSYSNTTQSPTVSGSATVAMAGNYTITVTDGNGCSDTETNDVTVNSLPVADAGSDVSIPYGTSTTIDGAASGGSGSYSFSWSPVDSLLNATIEDPTTVNLELSTVFTLTVTDITTSCQNTDQMTVTVTGGALTVNPTAVPTTICEGNSSQLNAMPSGGSGSYTYSWVSNPPGFISIIVDPIVSPLETTTYSVTVDDGFITATNSVIVTVNTLLTASIAGDNTICSGETTTLTASGGTSFEWSTTETTAAINVNTANTYSVTVTDDNGCTDIETSNVIVNTLPTATGSSNSPVCVGSSLTLTGGPGAMTTYAWSGPDSYSNATQSPTVSTSATVAMAGNYTITVTDANGCTDTETTNVTVNTLPTATGSSNSPVCVGSALTLTGGPGAMTSYAWSGPDSYSNATQSPTVSGSATVAMAGAYTITVTDGNGCTDTESTTVTVYSLPTAAIAGDNTICNGETTTLTVSGGTSYEWSTTETTAAINVNTANTYTVTVTDGNGCTNTVTTNVILNPVYTIPESATICDGDTYSWHGNNYTIAG
ncbi:MAG: hypothetical protein HY738_00710, partial [Bacteroidia bacterium]|nr:hypothetical protein [Bacteroidia bacterium]